MEGQHRFHCQQRFKSPGDVHLTKFVHFHPLQIINHVSYELNWVSKTSSHINQFHFSNSIDKNVIERKQSTGQPKKRNQVINFSRDTLLSKKSFVIEILATSSSLQIAIAYNFSHFPSSVAF